MRSKRNAVAILIGLALVLAASADAATLDERVSKLDSLFQELVRPDEPGAAVVVVKGGRVVYQSARGKSDLESGAALTVDTPIYVASIAKQFTAMATLRLVERGELSLDDRASRYVPELQPFASTVTIRQLLTHTSGLVDHLEIMKDEVDGWTNEDVLKLLSKENRLLFEPGSEASYSNSGYVVLAVAIERITGTRFSDVLTHEIFEPAGMRSTFVASCDGAVPANAARGYRSEEGRWHEDRYSACTTGAGGIFSTASDLARFDEALTDGKIVKKESLATASTAATLTSGKPTAFGFGWLAEFDADGPLANVWYTAAFGEFKGYRGLMKRIPERNLTIVVLTNRGAFPWPLVRLIHELYT